MISKQLKSSLFKILIWIASYLLYISTINNIQCASVDSIVNTSLSEAISNYLQQHDQISKVLLDFISSLGKYSDTIPFNLPIECLEDELSELLLRDCSFIKSLISLKSTYSTSPQLTSFDYSQESSDFVGDSELQSTLGATGGAEYIDPFDLKDSEDIVLEIQKKFHEKSKIYSPDQQSDLSSPVPFIILEHTPFYGFNVEGSPHIQSQQVYEDSNLEEIPSFKDFLKETLNDDIKKILSNEDIPSPIIIREHRNLINPSDDEFELSQKDDSIEDIYKEKRFSQSDSMVKTVGIDNVVVDEKRNFSPLTIGEDTYEGGSALLHSTNLLGKKYSHDTGTYSSSKPFYSPLIVADSVGYPISGNKDHLPQVTIESPEATFISEEESTSYSDLPRIEFDTKKTSDQYPDVSDEEESPLYSGLPLRIELPDISKSPLLQESEEFTSPLTQESEEFISPLTQESEEFISPLTQESEEFTPPLTQESEEFTPPLSQKSDKSKSPLTQESEKSKSPLTQKSEKSKSPLRRRTDESKSPHVTTVDESIQSDDIKPKANVFSGLKKGLFGKKERYTPKVDIHPKNKLTKIDINPPVVGGHCQGLQYGPKQVKRKPRIPIDPSEVTDYIIKQRKLLKRYGEYIKPLSTLLDIELYAKEISEWKSKYEDALNKIKKLEQKVHTLEGLLDPKSKPIYDINQTKARLKADAKRYRLIAQRLEAKMRALLKDLKLSAEINTNTVELERLLKVSTHAQNLILERVNHLQQRFNLLTGDLVEKSEGEFRRFIGLVSNENNNLNNIIQASVADTTLPVNFIQLEQDLNSLNLLINTLQSLHGDWVNLELVERESENYSKNCNNFLYLANQRITDKSDLQNKLILNRAKKRSKITKLGLRNYPLRHYIPTSISQINSMESKHQ